MLKLIDALLHIHFDSLALTADGLPAAHSKAHYGSLTLLKLIDALLYTHYGSLSLSNGAAVK